MFFHHPLYSSGETHGSADRQRELLEPVFLKHGVNVVLSGHEHFYERIKPQKGIAYFTLGNSGKVRRGDLLKTDLTAKGWDQGYGFMLMEVVGRRSHVPDDHGQGRDDRYRQHSSGREDRADSRPQQSAGSAGAEAAGVEVRTTLYVALRFQP